VTVYARGYRPYAGGFRRGFPALTIFREAYRTALQTKIMRRLRVIYLCMLFGFAATLYALIGTQDWIGALAGPGARPPAKVSWDTLRTTVEVFYGIGLFLAALVAILAGAGLVSDDLKTRALPLYLVRPLRPFDYALGKALVVPAVLVFVVLLPGPLFLFLTALWQPPGQTWSFLRDHLDLAGACAQAFLLASAGYGGLMLLLSSRTPRRSAVIGLGAAFVFGGLLLHGMASRLVGATGEALRALAIPMNAILPIVRVTRPRHMRRADAQDMLADPTVATLVCLAFLVLGFVAVWRRARTVEVTG
jgi:ABC-type transport system involved in multi-copper enzyme maturation permease subunit